MKNKSMYFWLNSSWINNNNQHYIMSTYADDIEKNIFFKKFLQCLNADFNENTFIISNAQTNIDIKKNEICKLINNFRKHGHKIAKIDPLLLNEKKTIKNLELSFYNLHNEDFQNKYLLKYIKKKISIHSSSLSILETLKKIYCSCIGFEYMYLNNIKEIRWIQHHIEHESKLFITEPSKKINILKNIIFSENFEKYLHYKFPGSKRFSLEGADVLIPMLKEIISYSKKNFVNKIMIGMAHRGRLNVLANILKKGLNNLFSEFFDNEIYSEISGDVKYHKGYHRKIYNKKNNIDVILSPNPSHLEFINPVILGMTRACIDSNSDLNTNSFIPIMIHGDASISGQGIVQETLNMSQSRGYSVGGTIHIIINNQIGFTTSNTRQIRSSTYCTDIAKMISSPVFHVNADDPDSVIFVTKLALLFRHNFKKDVFIDLVCYRRHGHNEFDDPFVTQPVLYKKIKKHPSVKDIYFNKLLKLGIVHSKFIDDIIQKQNESLDFEFTHTNKKAVNNKTIILNKFCKKSDSLSIAFNINQNNLSKLALSINIIPNVIKLHPKVHHIYLNRVKMSKGEQLFDWGASEILSYATLINNGVSCRLSGQDVERGTFFHRHAVVTDQLNNQQYVPLQNITNSLGKFYIWNSVLSETSVLAFEYGYALTAKKTLTIWEAQFGDFSNVAQVIIDQFISSGEQKWNVLCNLVLLLPHGYEGQGPEHSSARIERFLQLCAQNNMIIVVPTTAAQFFHVLRRQMLNNVLKPLVIFTPKSLLRNPLSFSSLDELSTGNFKNVITEVDDFNINKIKRVIFCTGKIFYELLTERRKQKISNIVIIRIEELYPFPKKVILQTITPFLYIKNFFWCQEEPLNQGAWIHVKNNLSNIIPVGSTLNCISRKPSSSPAVGSHSNHNQQQKKLIKKALNLMI